MKNIIIQVLQIFNLLICRELKKLVPSSLGKIKEDTNSDRNVFNFLNFFNFHIKWSLRNLNIITFTLTPLCSCNVYNVTAQENDRSGFVLITDVVPDAVLDIRYYTSYNFTGDSIPGYEEPVALMTRQAADSLKAVSDELRKMGYRIKVFDAYRPQCAVDFFMKWAQKPSDVRMKKEFYPEISKAMIIPQGYVARKSGHTRGSTIDLTLVDMKSGEEIDMGSTFDYFGTISHATILPGQKAGTHKPINKEQYRNRMILRKAMEQHGFKPYNGEWWHFTLRNEPYPHTYFTFPVRRK